MEETLRAEVDSDINSIPKHQRGLITTLRCIIKPMVIKNQEAKDALENYIRSFDITKFPGKNVPTACLCLKAIAGALGDNDLPTNIIRKVLEVLHNCRRPHSTTSAIAKLFCVKVVST